MAIVRNQDKTSRQQPVPNGNVLAGCDVKILADLAVVPDYDVWRKRLTFIFAPTLYYGMGLNSGVTSDVYVVETASLQQAGADNYTAVADTAQFLADFFVIINLPQVVESFAKGYHK